MPVTNKTVTIQLKAPIGPTEESTATELLELLDTSREEREDVILKHSLLGAIPSFQRKFKPVQVSGGGFSGTIYVLPQYWCLGTDEDFVFTPMNPMTAQKICTEFRCILPTKKMVDDIWTGAESIVSPKPMGPPAYPWDESMMHTSRWPVHTGWVRTQLSVLRADLTGIAAGYKKDIILDPWLEIDQRIRGVPIKPYSRAGIYGWHRLNGIPVHDFDTHSHEITYSDYSHGARMVYKTMYVSGHGALSVSSVLKDRIMWRLLSYSGPFRDAEYPVKNTDNAE